MFVGGRDKIEETWMGRASRVDDEGQEETAVATEDNREWSKDTTPISTATRVSGFVKGVPRAAAPEALKELATKIPLNTRTSIYVLSLQHFSGTARNHA